MGKSNKLVAGGTSPLPFDDIKDAENTKYPPTRSHPKGINPAYPNRNFVKTAYINKTKDTSRAAMQFSEYMYRGAYGNEPDSQKPHNVHGHTGAQRAGRLRLSGHSGAHQLGKRGK